MSVYLRPETEERLVSAKLRYWRVSTAALIVTLIVVGLGVYRLNLLSRSAAQQREAQYQLSQLILECTTAPGLRNPPVKNPDSTDCYVRGQQQLATTIGDPAGPINNVIILAAACAKQNGINTEREIRDCVIAGLAAHR